MAKMQVDKEVGISVYPKDGFVGFVVHQPEGERVFKLDTKNTLRLMLLLAQSLPEDIFPGFEEKELERAEA